MGLSTYKKKRNFKETPEPEGKVKASAGKLSFVIQRHKASHLHYDFRLEMEGVLKSWAVPKGPSLNPNDKRLAMMVEDHPYSYKNFAGIIPEGNYGAGIVEIWDEGYYTDLDNSDKKSAEKKLLAGLKAGNLKIRMHGKKLKGEFALVKLRGKEDNAWLLIKHRDEYSLDEPYNSEEHTPKNSPINKWLATHKRPASKRRLVKTKPVAEEQVVPKPQAVKKPKIYGPTNTRKMPEFISPMLAKETDKPFSDPDWIFEIKWDGYRAIAEVNHEDVQLYSRNGNSFLATYPAIVQELESLGINAVLDGEIIVLDDNGMPSFQLLQDYDNNRDKPIIYYVFDVLFVNGKNVCNLPLVERKKLLKKILPENDVIRYSDHIEENGKEFFKIAEQKDIEGIMAKQASSEYYPGRRTSSWLKIKHHKTQEAIITGFTEPGGSRKNFGALVLGVMDGKKLKYVGHTGSGFNNESLREMMQLLKSRIIKKSPFDEVIKTNMPVTWVKPELVCEIKFSEWTHDGRMRHPIFLHLRPDKKPAQVTLESMKTVSKAAAEKKSKASEAKKKTTKTAPPVKTAAKKTTVKQAAKKASRKNSKEGTVKIGNIEVKISNPEKIYWPDEGYTKGDVIKYYLEMADYILPYLKDRPESLKRNPNGITDFGFFQKDAGEAAPEWVDSKKIYSESINKDIDYILCNNKATIPYLNNLGCIELNPWHSTIQNLDYPDYLILDIDPSEKNTFDQVIECANVIHEILLKGKVESFCKTSGATGLHVYVPVGKKYNYEQVKDFAHLICMMTNEQLPKFTSLERNLKKRGKNKIYLDHLQNRRGQTIACAYSLRPHPGATVSTPLKWSEVKAGLTPAEFNIKTTAKRIKKLGDIFKGILGKGLDIEKCLKELEK